MSKPPRTLEISATKDDTIENSPIVAATQRWIERAVVGLNLCPFARTPLLLQRIRFHVSDARNTNALVADLSAELEMLQATDAQVCETTLLIHPFVLTDFLDYNDFLDTANSTLSALGLEGELQIASFHPDYRFADAEADAVENCSNRSPYPILHLLRETSVSRAIASMTDPDSIYRRNIQTLRALGKQGWTALWLEDAAGDQPKK